LTIRKPWENSTPPNFALLNDFNNLDASSLDFWMIFSGRGFLFVFYQDEWLWRKLGGYLTSQEKRALVLSFSICCGILEDIGSETSFRPYTKTLERHFSRSTFSCETIVEVLSDGICDSNFSTFSLSTSISTRIGEFSFLNSATKPDRPLRSFLRLLNCLAYVSVWAFVNDEKSSRNDRREVMTSLIKIIPCSTWIVWLVEEVDVFKLLSSLQSRVWVFFELEVTIIGVLLVLMV